MACKNFCQSMTRKLQVLGIGLIFRLCVFYVGGMHYDLIAKGFVLDFEVFGQSFSTYSLIVIIMCGLIMMMDVLVLYWSLTNPFSAVRLIYISWIIHVLVVLPVAGSGLYVGYSASSSSDSYTVNWMSKYTDMEDICAMENETSDNVFLLDNVHLLYEELRTVEREIRCCGWEGPEDYTTKFCPNLHENNTQFPWWAEQPEQEYPLSCCPDPKFGPACSINNQTKWFQSGCGHEFYDFVHRVLLAVNYLQLGSEAFAFILQLFFLFLMRNVQVPNEFKKMTSEDDDEVQKVEISPLINPKTSDGPMEKPNETIAVSKGADSQPENK